MLEISGIGVLTAFAAGAVMIVMGLAMITGYMTTFSYWMLRTFPVFGQIG